MAKLGKTIVIIFLVFLFEFLAKTNFSFADSIISNWTSTTSLPTNLASNTGYVYNNKIYSLGGANFSPPQTYVFSTINPDGTLGPWQNISSQPQPRYWHTTSGVDNYVYILGGADSSSTNVSDSLVGKIDSSGDISEWTSITPLPETLAQGSSVIVGNKIYYAGGFTNASQPNNTLVDKIYMATINMSNGTIGGWSNIGTLPQSMFGFQMMEINGYIFIFGGQVNNHDLTDVKRAPINPDGTLGDWQEQSSLLISNDRFGLVRIGDQLVEVGGQAFGSLKNFVFYTQINPDFSISSWTQDQNPLPIDTCCGVILTNGNYIYSIGGYGGNYLSDVYFTQFLGNTTPTPTPSPSPSPSPSPTPIPIPTTSPSPTPTLIPVKKVFFAPGLGGSWNLDAIMNCKTSNYSGTWQLAPFAKKVYQPFFDAINLTNWKLNTFYYDWRADVRDNGNLLNDFINSKTLQDEKVNFIGHSMGGLVGRSYMENNSGGKLDSYLSVGTPHKGSTYSYPTVSAQDVESDDLIEKIATTILIKHCGAPISIQNLLPTYDYLKDRKTGTVKLVSSMKIKNNYLPTNFSSPFWGVKVGTLSGTGLPTLKMYETNPPSLIDQLRGVWLDGKPVKKINTNEGDGTVLLTSSQLDGASSNEVITESHSGIIGTTNGINKILGFLGNPPVEDPPFVEPKSALVLIGNNGNFWVKDKKGNVTQSEQGIVSYVNPESQDFDIKIIPQNSNSLFIVAQFLPNGNVLYKEYKYKGINPISKNLHFSINNPKEDILE